jgi:TolB protein
VTALLVVAACSNGGAPDPGAPPAGTTIAIELSGSLQNPCWSPSGDRLALTRFADGYNQGEPAVAIASLDGASQVVTPADGDGVNLPGSCFDRAGRIVYSTDGVAGDEIWTTSAGGRRPARVSAPAGHSAWEPSFSPDGQWIVFEAHDTSGNGPGELWKVHRDGASLTRLTRGSDDREPNWSPRGDRIVFQSQRAGNWDVWTVDPSGGHLRRITTDSYDDTDPSWSPDGTRVVYSADGADRDLADLFVITPGGAPVEVHAAPDSDYAGAPAWSPDGRRIAFETCAGDPDGGRGTHIAVVPAPR